MRNKYFLFSFLICLFVQKANAQYNLVGSTTSTVGPCFTQFNLTHNLASEKGAVWRNVQIDLNDSFDLRGEVFLGFVDGNGADGLAFVLQNESDVALYGDGGHLGYSTILPSGLSTSGITNSLIVEFDSYQNGFDPWYDHISMQKNGWADHSVLANQLAGPAQMSVSSTNSEDGLPHKYRITWDPISLTLNVYFDCTLRLSYTGDIVNTIFGGSPNVWWGFTGASGGLTNTQWFSAYMAPTYTPSTTSTSTGCGGTTGTLDVTGLIQPGCASYSWSPGGATTSSITGLSAGIYTVTITEWFSCPIVITDTVTSTAGAITVDIIDSSGVTCFGGNDGFVIAAGLTGTAPFTYLWSNLQTNDTASGLSSGVYYVTVTDFGGCTGIDSVVIDFPPPIFINLTGVNSDCVPNAAYAYATASGGVGALSYSWNTVPIQNTDTAFGLSSGTYTVSVTDGNSCIVNDLITVVGPSAILDVTASSDAPKCLDNEVNLIANASDGVGPYSYSWTPSGLSSQSIVDIPSSIAPTTFLVTVTDSNNCTDTASVTFEMYASPIVTLNSLDDLCVDDEPLFLNQGLPAGGIYSGTGVNGSEFDPSIGAGNYVIGYFFSDPLTSCSGSISGSILVHDLPLVNISHSPYQVTLSNPEVAFRDASEGGVAWNWTFGDTYSSSHQNPNHAYSDTGLYRVELILMDEFGCVNAAKDSVLVLPSFSLFIPNIFSPNADGRNDFFLAKGNGILEYELLIFDRWGQKLFHTKDLYDGWDGSNSPSGNYVYKISLIDLENISHSYVGNVSVLR